jgi:hypothetical protein
MVISFTERFPLPPKPVGVFLKKAMFVDDLLGKA